MALLPLFDISHLPDSAWLVDPPAPTGLLVGTPCLVSAEEAMPALADFIGEAVEVAHLDPPPHQSWLTQVMVPGISTPLLFFAAPRTADDGLDIPATDCPFLLGIEGLLHPVDPLTVYVNLVRLLVGAAGEALFAWDVVTNRVLSGDGLAESFLGEGVEPPDRVLWVTEAIETAPDSWLIQTRGLHRCGRAELAVTNVPKSMHHNALVLIDGLASLCLEQPLPGPGRVIQVGSNLDVRLETAESCELNDRVTIPTAVIRDPNGEDATATLSSLGGSEVSMYRSSRTTTRETKLARDSWATFSAFCEQHCRSIDCLVQVPFIPPDGSDADTHHLWLRAVSSDGTSIVAELLHAPQDAVGLVMGDRHDINAETVSSWCVMLPEGPHGPDAADELARRLNT
ncbi:MAG: hypothetical protein VX527_03220 [Planctomycetota bacterium]|nr:hypothetical protein [Planctomycetota bacterium]